MIKCASHQSPRPQRRINGFQLPLNYHQVVGWIVIITTALLNFLIIINIQFDELKTISMGVFVVLYASHIVVHVAASFLDPSEKELRSLEVHNVPEFDRSVHAHVIENGRCHLCNINTSSRKTKHCSICNKCVDRFDHHCKWLNNCIGRRNYVAFLACVCTAMMISAYTSSLCVTDIVIFFTNPIHLSNEAQNYINCSTPVNASTSIVYCIKSISFLTFLTVFCISAIAIGCALLHLYCFHIYISLLGISTYEYVVRSGTETYECINNCKCGRMAISKKLYTISKTKPNTDSTDNPDNNPMRSEQSDIPSEETNVINFIGILINSELDRAKKMFIYDNNKVHPHEGTNDSRQHTL